MSEFLGTATYDPGDNKLRFYPFHRLSTEDYQRVKSSGFAWAPKQELFVAPMWTPSREDLLIELCGEIDDEDTSLVERAEAKQERLEDLADRKLSQARSAQAAVSAIADNIPFGQPILVGHHSEKRARKDAERIRNGMDKAVKLWDQSNYWKDRAAGAIRLAKYKERPDVRARRIKGLESDLRKQNKNKAESEKSISAWESVLSLEGETQKKVALQIANFSHFYRCFTLAEYPRDHHTYEGEMGLWGALDQGIITPVQAAEIALESSRAYLPTCERWIAHFENRIAYERAMLEEAGGLAAEKFDIQVGGRVLAKGEWVTVIRINKSGGKVVSLTTNARYVSVIGIEKVSDYQAPEPEAAKAVTEALKKPPICNYPGNIALKARWGGYDSEPIDTLEMTEAEWKRIYKDHKGTQTVLANPEQGEHRVRFAIRSGKWRPVFLTDAKRKDPPAPSGEVAAKPKIKAPERDFEAVPARHYKEPERNELDDLRDTLKAGVKVVVADQLFPTPPELAERMVELAEIKAGMRILEPSAGTGNIVKAIRKSEPGAHITAIEANYQVALVLAKCIGFPAQRFTAMNEDFLAQNGNLGEFDAIVMNPPFHNGEDIKHILHATKFLRPGGRLVAICAAGPRQQEQLAPLGEWIPLPEGTFKESGTHVNTAIIVINN